MGDGGLLRNWRSRGPEHRVFLGSSLNFWFPSPGSGQREGGRLSHLLVVRGGCRETGSHVVRMGLFLW